MYKKKPHERQKIMRLRADPYLQFSWRFLIKLVFYKIYKNGCGGWIRTSECQIQGLVPYRLATPQW